MKPSDVVLYPSVDLNFIERSILLRDGLVVCATSYCKKKILNDKQCLKHYSELKESLISSWRQCPYGFSSYSFFIDDHKIAITGIIPFPRVGNSIERERAKSSPDQKIPILAIEKNVDAIRSIYLNLKQEVAAEITRSLAALHEVRKYNRNLKQTLERFCMRNSPQDPDLAQAEVVKAWKISEFMSYQFDVLGLIADENLVQLPPKTESEIYKVFDKCVRLFNLFAIDRKIRLTIKGDSPRAIVSDKTFPIMATVLIDNAIKYGVEGGNVDIEIKIIDINRFRVTVGNDISKESVIPSDPFQRGTRGDQDSDGSGVGLFLAQLVAAQHGTKIKYERIRTGLKVDRVEFEFQMTSIE